VTWRDKLFGQDSDQEGEFEEEKTEPNVLEDDLIWHPGDTVYNIVKNISSAKGLPIEETAKGLYRAVEEGKVRLIDPSPPQSFLAYITSFYTIWFWIVFGFVGLVMASIYIFPQTYPIVYLRYTTGTLFILFMPGYVLIEALYPKAGELEKLERFALDIGLSLAVVPLVGFVLNYTPWGIKLDPIFSSLSILVIILGFFGVYRKYTNLDLSQKYVKP
jgi:hypothetical protein